jgi:alpha-L-fucosidase
MALAGALPFSRLAAQQPSPNLGAFRPSWESLTAGYRAPEWFRDAKFGIWAHWSAQCVPESGDWYARDMYLQGSRAYKHHLANYGHPSETGFLEIEGKWKAERWDPARLLDLYQRAGARYFVALANHHDNFDAYDSTHHAWNSVRVGPKRDIVGTWARLARERGIRFGVSNHSAHAWHWYQPAYGYDPEGPLQGKRYDAFHLTKAAGKGKWWEGLDPQQLYTGRTMPMPDGITSIEAANRWHEENDRKWDESAPASNPEFVRNWTLRCRELIDKYEPDLLYFDNFDLPLEQAGLDMAAHFYNSNMARHGGRLEAVLNTKHLPAERRSALVEDVERGAKSAISETPWQTDTCIGNWHYDRDLYDRDGYKNARTVVHTLCDVVSKNGNLLLSVPLRGDGTIDEKEERIVEGVAAWMGLHGDAIYGTRPWRTFGEGPTQTKSGMFAESGPRSPFGARDIRYAQSRDAVHGFVLGWPEDGVARLSALGTNAGTGGGEVQRVTFAHSQAPLKFNRTGEALEVMLPEAARDTIGVALVIQGRGLAA